MLSRFTHLETYIILHFFLWLNDIPLSGYPTFSLSVQAFVFARSQEEQGVESDSLVVRASFWGGEKFWN